MEKHTRMIKAKEMPQKIEFLGMLQRKKLAWFNSLTVLDMDIKSVIKIEGIPMTIKPQELDQHGQSLQAARRANTK